LGGGNVSLWTKHWFHAEVWDAGKRVLGTEGQFARLFPTIRGQKYPLKRGGEKDWGKQPSQKSTGGGTGQRSDKIGGREGGAAKKKSEADPET